MSVCQGSCKWAADVKSLTTWQRRPATLAVAFSSNVQMNKAICLSQGRVCVFVSLSLASCCLYSLALFSPSLLMSICLSAHCFNPLSIASPWLCVFPSLHLSYVFRCGVKNYCQIMNTTPAVCVCTVFCASLFLLLTTFCSIYWMQINIMSHKRELYWLNDQRSTLWPL